MVLLVLCLGVDFYLLFVPYVCVHILVRFRLLSGGLLGNSCSLGLQCVFLVQLSNCQFSFFPPVFFLIAPFPDHCLFVPFYNQCYRELCKSKAQQHYKAAVESETNIL